jgi:hypothetical protein
MSESISLRPSTYTEGSIFNDIDFEVIVAKFAMYDYGGKSDRGPAPAIVLDLDVGSDKPISQAWSVGKAADWMPSEDGKRLLAIGKQKALNTSSNAAMLLTSMVNAGLPEDMLGEDIGVLVGLRGHMDRIPSPKKRGDLKEGKEDTVLLVTSISSLPGEKKAAAKGKGGKAAAAKEEASPSKDEEDAVNAVIEVLSEEPGPVPKKALATKLLPKIMTFPNKTAVLKLAVNDEFLSGADRPWVYSGGELSLG